MDLSGPSAAMEGLQVPGSSCAREDASSLKTILPLAIGVHQSVEGVDLVPHSEFGSCARVRFLVALSSTSAEPDASCCL